MNESTAYSTKMFCFLAGGLAGDSVALPPDLTGKGAGGVAEGAAG